MKTRLGFEHLGVGVGLRSVHYGEITQSGPPVDFFEVLSDNYLFTRGRPLEVLDRIAARYPVVMHGVALSIGSTDPLDYDYLKELRALRARIGARWISDHLCFSANGGHFSHDLLPLPYTEETLWHVVRRIQRVQDFLDAPLVLENPSSYVEFSGDTLREWEFLREVLQLSGAGLLLDVNNVYVSARNHGFDPEAYLAALPMDHVVQLHVAGHTDYGTHAIDTHVGPVPDPVWDLLARARALGADASVVVEWDTDIPSFERVHGEANAAKGVLARSARRGAA